MLLCLLGTKSSYDKMQVSWCAVLRTTAFKKFSKCVTIKRQQLEQQPEKIKLSAAANSLLLNFMPCCDLNIPGVTSFCKFWMLKWRTGGNAKFSYFPLRLFWVCPHLPKCFLNYGLAGIAIRFFFSFSPSHPCSKYFLQVISKYVLFFISFFLQFVIWPGNKNAALWNLSNTTSDICIFLL